MAEHLHQPTCGGAIPTKGIATSVARATLAPCLWIGRKDAGQQRSRTADMHLTDIPFGTTDWGEIAPVEHSGDTGVATWRTRQFGELRVRMVEYSPGYRADHWCEKGHIVLCMAGELETELRDGRVFRLRPGMSYQVADHTDAHRSSTTTGATLFIVD